MLKAKSQLKENKKFTKCQWLLTHFFPMFLFDPPKITRKSLVLSCFYRDKLENIPEESAKEVLI